MQAALAANPQVRAAKAQYEAAFHQVEQAYAPQDPQLSFASGASPRGFDHPAVETIAVGESFQFPGKSWLEGGQAKRAAEIARLGYLATLRDLKAQVLTA